MKGGPGVPSDRGNKFFKAKTATGGVSHVWGRKGIASVCGASLTECKSDRAKGCKSTKDAVGCRIIGQVVLRTRLRHDKRIVRQLSDNTKQAAPPLSWTMQVYPLSAGRGEFHI